MDFLLNARMLERMVAADCVQARLVHDSQNYFITRSLPCGKDRTRGNTRTRVRENGNTAVKSRSRICNSSSSRRGSGTMDVRITGFIGQ